MSLNYESLYTTATGGNLRSCSYDRKFSPALALANRIATRFDPISGFSTLESKSTHKACAVEKSEVKFAIFPCQDGSGLFTSAVFIDLTIFYIFRLDVHSWSSSNGYAVKLQKTFHKE